MSAGERYSISESKKFKKLMVAGYYGIVIDITKKEVESAYVIDINADNSSLDSVAVIQRFI